MMARFLRLSSGFDMPIIGLGTWMSKANELERTIVSAVEAGYRHFDCAYAYGNEKEIGAALNKLFSSGVVKRSELFITTKLWNTRHRPENVKPSLVESLTMLGLDYVDLYLIHWPQSYKAGADMFPTDEQGNGIYDVVHYMETWKALEKCVDEGLIKSIGLSNFNSGQIQQVLDESRIKPAVLQIEVNPYFQQTKLVSFCQQRNVAVTAFSCLGSPARPWAKETDPTQLDDPVIQEISRRLGRTPAQVILRWLIQRGISVIPKSVTKSRIIENFQAYDFELSVEDMERIKTIDRNLRCLNLLIEVNGKMVPRDAAAPHYPFNIEF